MVKEMNFSKPVRQGYADKKPSLKTPFSQRNGTRTAKNMVRHTSKETFDDFVHRMKNKQTRITENSYSNKARPYTSNGCGGLRIKHHRKPLQKTGMGIKLYDEVQTYSYAKKKTFIYKENRRKSNNKHENRASNLLNETDSQKLKHR